MSSINTATLPIRDAEFQEPTMLEEERKRESLMASKIGIPEEVVEGKILLVRGQKVMLDSDLAVLYEVETKVLNQAVKRNQPRFPEDFMFQLTAEEAVSLRSQFVTSKRGGRRYRSYAFTEQGVAMLSSVLNSERAIQVNIAIMRAFVKLRQILSTHKDLARQLEVMEKKYDAQFKVVFDALRQLMQPNPSSTKRIGFTTAKPSHKK